MRTPDDDASAGDPGSLAEGYGAGDLDDNHGDGFGDGFTDAAEAADAADAAEAVDPSGASGELDPLEPGAGPVDPDDPVDDVDVAAVIEGATALFDSGLEHATDDHQAAHDGDGGLFDL